jgi:hypothetical protein
MTNPNRTVGNRVVESPGSDSFESSFWIFIRWSIPQLRKNQNMKSLVAPHFLDLGLQSEILRENLDLFWLWNDQLW